MIGISMVVHNNLEHTQRCIGAVTRATRSHWRLLVTDNGSRDGTWEYLSGVAARDRRILLRRNVENLGFGVPHNRAIGELLKIPGIEYIAVLNNDTVPPDAWDLGLLAPFQLNDKVMVTGPRNACCRLSSEGCGHPAPNGEPPEYIEGSCMMMRASLAREMTVFDPAYRFAYFEDSDFSLRVRERGYLIAHGDVSVPHVGAATRRIVKDIDVEGYEKRNQQVFRTRWRRYLEHRGFDKSALVIRGGATGDVLLATPLVETLRSMGYSIDFVTQCPAVVQGHPFITAVTHEEVRPRSVYQRVINLDLAYEKRPMMHISDAYHEEAGIIPGGAVNRIPSFHPHREHVEWVQKTYGRRASRAVFHAGPTAWPGRNWEGDGFGKVAKHLADKGWETVTVGLPENHLVAHTQDLRGALSLPRLGALMMQSQLFVGIDSAPMHFAVAAQIRTVGVFGSIDPRFRLPGVDWAVGVTADERKVGCLGCHHTLPAPRTDGVCLRDRIHCMEKLGADRVIAAVDQVLATGDLSHAGV